VDRGVSDYRSIESSSIRSAKGPNPLAKALKVLLPGILQIPERAPVLSSRERNPLRPPVVNFSHEFSRGPGGNPERLQNRPREVVEIDGGDELCPGFERCRKHVTVFGIGQGES
jgi:hypothetical protein